MAKGSADTALFGSQKELFTAYDYINKAIAMNPNDAEAITYYADVLISKLSYTNQSIKVFEKAIKCNPANKYVKTKLKSIKY